MLANWIKATTTTTGTGTLTLSAVSGFPLPGDALPTDAFVAYSIVTSDGKTESGYGKLGASSTLARTLAKATFDGTTYNNTTATALSLASGTHTVIVDRVAEFGQNGLSFPFISGPTNPNIVSTHLIGAPANAAVGAAAQRATAWPFRLEVGGILTAMSVNVSSGNAASQTLHLGLYEPGSDGWPARRLARTSTTIDTSTTGFKSQAVSSNVALSPGWYWVAACLTSATAVPNLTGVTVVSPCPMGNAGGSQILNVRSDTGSTTDLADPFPTTSKIYTTGSSAAPYIGLIFA